MLRENKKEAAQTEQPDKDSNKDIVTDDMEALYADILEDRVTVVYRSKVWEIIKSRFGFGDD